MRPMTSSERIFAKRLDLPGEDLRGLLRDAEHAEPLAAGRERADQRGPVEEERVARRVGAAEQVLDVVFQLLDLSPLALVRVEKPFRLSAGGRPGQFHLRADAEEPRRSPARPPGRRSRRTGPPSSWTRTRSWKPAGRRASSRSHSRDDVGRRRRAELAHRGPAAPPLRHGGRAVDARPLAVLDHQPARGDQRGDLGVAELAQQAPDVAVDRLGPDPLPRAEVAADQGRVDPRVRGRGVEGDQAALAVAGNADLRPRPRPVP